MNSISTLKSYEYYKNLKRFNDYNQMLKYLNDIGLSKDSCIVYSDHKKLLTSSISLYKRIGSSSVYGVVFKSKNINPKFKVPKFIVKIQYNTRSLMRETQLLEQLSDYGIKNKIPNLPILYKIIKCVKSLDISNFPKIYKKNLIENGYTMIISELASGDLNYFLNNKYAYNLTEEIWRNIYEQTYISLAILHSLGIKHNDAHDGNFLFHKIKPGGCFHYRINGIDFYIKNIGYLWTSWDYGLISKLDDDLSYIEDYMLLNIMIRKDDYKKTTREYKTHYFYYKWDWGYLEPYVTVPSSIEKLQSKLWELTGGYNKNKNKLPEYDFLRYLLDQGLLFSSDPIGKIISSVTINLPEKTKSYSTKNKISISSKYL